MAIGIKTTVKGNGELMYSADGTVRMTVLASSAIVAKTGYKVIWNEYGPCTAAQADDVYNYMMGYAEVAHASGDVFDILVAGPIDDAITPSLDTTAGHALAMTNGAAVDAGADYSGATSQYAVVRTTSGSASTTQDLWLVPRYITATT